MKKALSVLLALVMALTVIPLTGINAFAYTYHDYTEYISVRSEDELWEYRTLGNTSIEIINYSIEHYTESDGWECYDNYTENTFGSAYYGSEPNLVIPSTIDGYTVSGIGREAFKGMSFLKSVTIPNSVTSIGYEAFYGCSSLASVTIPNSVTSIGSSTFSGCTALTNVTIPDSVTGIGENAFTNTAYYNNDDNWEDGVLYIGNHLIEAKNTLSGEYAIKESTKTIAPDAFSGCSSLIGVTIPGSVTSIGNSAFEECSSLASINIPDSVTSIGYSAFSGCSSLIGVTIPNSVVSIGSFAFEYCTSLTSITIPDGVTSIGQQAFWGCESLKDVTVYYNPICNYSNVYTNEYDYEDDYGYEFIRIRPITKVVVPNNVTSISDHAFSGCSSLASITIPDSVTSIGSSAFEKTAYYNNDDNWKDGVLYIGNHLIKAKNTLSGEYAIKESTKTIAGSAFSGCTSLTSITIPGSVTSIGREAFYNCSSLTSITIPNNVTCIGDDAFYNCAALVSITVDSGNTVYDSRNNCNAIIETASNTLIAGCQNTVIPNSVTSIVSNAFYGCTSLASITIPAGVTSIGSNAFCGCTSLTSITVDSRNTVYDSRNNCNAIIETASNTLLIGCQNTVIPNSVTSISDSAFSGCTSLTVIYNPACDYYNVNSFITKVTFPDEVKEIKAGAFYGWSALESVEIPFGVTTLPLYSRSYDDVVGESHYEYRGVFEGCTSLKSVTLPDSLTTIDAFAFSGCTSLKNITIGKNVKEIGGGAFYRCLSLESVDIPFGVTTLSTFEPYYNYDHTYYGAFSGCTALKNVTLPASLISVGDYAFSGCTSLTSITIPGSVTSIGQYAFYNCTKLKNITIPRSVTSIGYRALVTYNQELDKYSFIDTITGYTGSYAETYAKENGITFIALDAQACTHDHTEIRNQSAATCTQNGNTGDTYCADCGELIQSGTVIRATGHPEAEWVITKKATYTEAGQKELKCTVCGTTIQTEAIPKLIGVDLSATTTAVKVANAKDGVNVSWAAVNGAQGYYVYRKTGTGSYSKIATTTALSYLDKTAQAGTTYTYAVRAYNGNSLSGFAGVDTVRLTNPAVKVANAKAGANVTWGKVAGAKGYYVYRKTGSGSYSKIATTTALSYVDKTAKSGTTYTYTVRAYNGSTLSSYAGVKLIRLANTTVKLANQTAGVKVFWTKVAGAKGYYVYRKTGTGKYSKIATTTALSFVDKTAKAGVKYTYAVRAYNGSTQDAFTAVSIVRLTTPTVKLANTKSGPKATWGKIAGAKGYYVYRKTAGGSYKKIATTTSLSYVDKTAKSGTRYYYIVKAYNGKSISSYAMKAITCKK